MLTVPEAARRAGRNPETIRRWIRSGRLASRRIGTQHVIDEEDLLMMLDEGTVPVPSGWKRTVAGEPMPDVLAAIRRTRAGH